jgi:hypothetical protein
MVKIDSGLWHKVVHGKCARIDSGVDIGEVVVNYGRGVQYIMFSLDSASAPDRNKWCGPSGRTVPIR